MIETFKAAVLVSSERSDFKVIVESPFQRELQVIVHSSFGVVECEHGVCVLAGYVAPDNTWPCWIGTGTGDELKESLKDRFNTDSTWQRAIVLPCQTADEATSMATALSWMLSTAPNPVLAEPTTKPVLALEAVMRFLTLSGHYTHDPLGQNVLPAP